MTVIVESTTGMVMQVISGDEEPVMLRSNETEFGMPDWDYD